MNPWAEEAPDCPRCEVALYLWEFNTDNWYCGECMRIWDMREQRDIGGQGSFL